MSMELRPLSLGELLDRSFTLYRRHFITFVGIMAVPAAVTLLFSLSSQLVPHRAAQTASTLNPVSAGWIMTGALFGMMLLLAYVLAYMVALGATTAAVSELYLDRPITIAGAYAQMRGLKGSLMILMLLTGLRVLGAILVTLLVIGIIMGIFGSGAPFLGGLLAILTGLAGFVLVMLMTLRYALAVPALTLEPLSPSEAIRRSVDLTRGNVWRVFVLTIFASIITYISVMIFQVPLLTAAMIAGPESAAAFWLNLAAAVTGAIASAISGPIMIIALAVLYYDVRIRHEGLDLQIMMEKLGATPAVTPSGAFPA